MNYNIFTPGDKNNFKIFLEIQHGINLNQAEIELKALSNEDNSLEKIYEICLKYMKITPWYNDNIFTFSNPTDKNDLITDFFNKNSNTLIYNELMHLSCVCLLCNKFSSNTTSHLSPSNIFNEYYANPYFDEQYKMNQNNFTALVRKSCKKDLLRLFLDSSGKRNNYFSSISKALPYALISSSNHYPFKDISESTIFDINSLDEYNAKFNKIKNYVKKTHNIFNSIYTSNATKTINYLIDFYMLETLVPSLGHDECIKLYEGIISKSPLLSNRAINAISNIYVFPNVYNRALLLEYIQKHLEANLEIPYNSVITTHHFDRDPYQTIPYNTNEYYSILMDYISYFIKYYSFNYYPILESMFTYLVNYFFEDESTIEKYIIDTFTNNLPTIELLNTSTSLKEQNIIRNLYTNLYFLKLKDIDKYALSRNIDFLHNSESNFTQSMLYHTRAYYDNI